MFGYIRPLKGELRVRDYELYQGIYCGLCRELGRGFGPFARLTLSYDFSFLAILSMALAQDCKGFEEARCPFNPIKKKLCCRGNPSMDLAAGVAMIMLEIKLEDNLADGGFWTRLGCRLVRPWVRRARRRAAERYPTLDTAIGQALERQQTIEADLRSGPDRASEPTAQALEAVFGALSREEGQRRALARFGYMLGRWIYLMDAVDDLEEDLQSGNFNPYLPAGAKEVSLEAIRAEAAGSLNLTAAEAAGAYNLLELHAFREILDNIVYLGLHAEQRRVLRLDMHPAEKERLDGSI